MDDDIKLVDDAITGILKPLGFKKRKLLWWRECAEITQVIGLDKMTYGFPHYNFRCGLILEKFKSPNIPRITINEMNLDWQAPLHETTAEERMQFRSALDMDSTISSVEREKLIKKLVLDSALPAFDATDTIEKLRSILKDKKHPFKTFLTTFRLEDL